VLTTAQKEGILKLLRPTLADPDRCVSITYRLYQGVTQDGDGENVDSWQSFSVPALTGKGGKFGTVDAQVQLQAGKRRFIFLEEDLATGVTTGDLTRNDKIVYAGETLDISRISTISGLCIKVECEGEE